MKKVLFCFFFLPLLLAAQIDESDTLKVKASLSVTGFWQGGNVETWIFRTSADVRFQALERWVFDTKNSFVYQAFGRQKADEDLLSRNFLYFNPKQRVYPLLIGIASSNFRRRIDVRYLIGGGITYQILTKKENWLKFSISSEYERTNFNQDNFNLAEYNGNSSINTLRGTLWLNGRHQILDKKIIFKHESYFQPSLQRSNNFRWRTDLGLEIPFWKFISFTINYVDTFESIVIEGQRLEDRLLSFGLVLKSFE